MCANLKTPQILKIERSAQRLSHRVCMGDGGYGWWAPVNSQPSFRQFIPLGSSVWYCGSTRNQTANDVQIYEPDLYECKRCKKQYIGETKRTLRERFTGFTGHRQATNNPSHPNVSAAVPTHFNLPDHSIEDMTLIPLELQPTLNTSRRKAREAYLIHRGQTLEPSGMNRRGSCPFRKRSMPFSRHLKSFLTINKFFCTYLKKKENMQATTWYRTRNVCFLTFLLYHYTARFIRQISAKFNYKTWRS